MEEKIKIKKSDVLIIVDLQNDFCPGGALPVPGGDEIVEPINKISPRFSLVITSQDWHPKDHCSFKENGGDWPVHCVARTRGADFHPSLNLDRVQIFIKKATTRNIEAFSPFESGTLLGKMLRHLKIKRIFVCGLATDYCVKATVLDALKDLDALKKGFEVFVILDTIRAVNINPDDEKNALDEMKKAGAKFVNSSFLS